MDHRKALVAGSVLDFPGMPCTLEREIGRGSNAIVYGGSYPDRLNRDQRHTVLVKELFPLHPKGAVYRNSQGGVSREPEGEEVFALHARSFAHGNQVHLRMLEKYPESTGGNLNTFSLGDTMYTVLGCTGGRSLASAGETANLRLLTLRLLRLLDSLQAFHESGFLHLDIAPDNILLIGQGSREQVMLIDYNSVYELHGQTGPDYASVKEGYSAPEILTGGTPSPASDLYSVTAVFFCCLTGAALTPFQMSRPKPPDVSDCPALRDQPDTVAAMVARILRKGLQSLPRRRWQSVAEMRRDAEELLDRIDGVGITHWALWEGGRKMVDRAIRENASLAFIHQREELFPANVRAEDGEDPLPFSDYLASLAAQPRRASQLTAPGGMGKTTALLRGVMEQSQNYTPFRPAVLYVSLYGWREGDTAYIHNRILENLHFRPEHKNFADARYILDQLMQTPLQTPQGERPVLLLLLDGLNEVCGPAQPLLEEIAALARLPGVSLLVSGRTAEAGLPFPAAVLESLRDEDVLEGLARHGLLPPESDEMRRLLQTPLMLSIFLQSAREEGRQLFVNTREELLGTYFAALHTKELRDLPEDAVRRWQADTAISFVLPSIAAELERKQRGLNDRELLTVVERCYKLLFSTRLLKRAFPQWIGHGKDIRGQAANAEEWYGQIVHELIWKRLGLLTRDEQGAYQISHQIIREYLCTLDKANQQRVWQQHRKNLGILAVVCLLLLASGWVAYYKWVRPQPYEESKAENVYTYGNMSYTWAGRQYEQIRELLNCAVDTPEDYPGQLSLYQSHVDRMRSDEDEMETKAKKCLEEMLPTGSVMPWSWKPLEVDYYKDLCHLVVDRREKYAVLTDVLTWVMEDEVEGAIYQEKYQALLFRLIEADASITARLYQLVCLPHATGKYAEDSDLAAARTIRQSVSDVPYQGIHINFQVTDPAMLKRELENFYGQRAAVLEDLRTSGILAAYEKDTEKTVIL
ncbi:MAG: hypothetical protein K2N78_06115 [Oscillospiraceae bacterium]|nr:hypothetical protein [Oscillospiraceae bacterium]